jgi:hypothetical protein
MAYSWIIERMAEDHRRDLTVSRAHSLSVPDPGDFTMGASLHSVEREPRHSPHEPRRPIGHHVGTLLIRVGMRLGGASMHTS